jgi:hypothetical protein
VVFISLYLQEQFQTLYFSARNLLLVFKTSLEYFNLLLKNKGENYAIRQQFIASYSAGLLTSVLVLPIWTLRTRLSLLTIDKSEKSKVKYK